MKKKILKYLKITGVIVGILAVLVTVLVIAIRFTVVGKYITFDLLTLIGMTLVALLFLAVLIGFIVSDFLRIRKRKRNPFSGIQNAMDIISEAFRHNNDR